MVGILAPLAILFSFTTLSVFLFPGAERDKMAKVYPYYGATSLGGDYIDNYLFDGIYLLLGEDGTVVDGLGFPILNMSMDNFGSTITQG